jgi:hypothetical protein
MRVPGSGASRSATSVGGSVEVVGGGNERNRVVVVTVTQEYAEALVARVVGARSQLAEASAAADLPGIAAALNELEDAYTLARESGVAIPRATSTKKEEAGS